MGEVPLYIGSSQHIFLDTPVLIWDAPPDVTSLHLAVAPGKQVKLEVQLAKGCVFVK